MMITVPASTANLGAGFDSIGLALSLYLTVEVDEHDTWEVHAASENLRFLPRDESHFIVQVAKKVAERYRKELQPSRLVISSDIPLARGLGSSAAAVVAGIELADQLGSLGLTNKEKLVLATEFEGHPDNVGAAIYGGLIISCWDEGEVQIVSSPFVPMDIVAVIPPDKLETATARNVLPASLPFPEAVLAGAISSVLVAALLQEKWELVGEMMKRDRYHQPYRKHLIPHYSEIESAAIEHGAFGVALSGAGPTIACFVEKSKSTILHQELKGFLPHKQVLHLSIDSKGVQLNNQSKVRPSSI